VVCVGARPIAVTNCLNFASPERPEVMWSFSEVIDGLTEACIAFDTPVVSGNVSFYNETDGLGILPTPTIGMVGLIEDSRKIVTHGFKNEGDIIAVLGITNDDLSVSEYAQSVMGESTDDMIDNGVVPKIDLALEKNVQDTCLKLIEAGLIRSAHDCSDGGLAVTIAECCFSSLGRDAIGAKLELSSGELSAEALLFSESPSRIVVSFAEEDLAAVRALIGDCPFTVIGSVSEDELRISIDGDPVITSPVVDLESVWETSLENRLNSSEKTKK
jgi:phosphoribosylformylglycinamidine synthase